MKKLSAIVYVAVFLGFLWSCEQDTSQRGLPNNIDNRRDTEQKEENISWNLSEDELTVQSTGQDPQTFAQMCMKTNIQIVLDCSGSMNEVVSGATKLASAKRALEVWVENLPDDVNLGFATFYLSQQQQLVEIGPDQKQRVIDELKHIVADGGTPLRSALEFGSSKLRQQWRKQLGYGQYQLVVVTDGEAGFNQDPVDTMRSLASTPIELTTIGFGTGSGHSMNKPRLARFLVASNEEELTKQLAEIKPESD